MNVARSLNAPGEPAMVGKLQQRSTRMLFFVGGIGAAVWASGPLREIEGVTR
jgi:hypothetical protein